MIEHVPENEIRHLEVTLSEFREGGRIDGTLRIPPAPIGWVIFAHGSGSSRLSPRNIQVAKELNQAHIATLLFDLLSPMESENRKNVFDIPLLAERLMEATEWVKKHRDYNGRPIGYFGASTGAAAALVAASRYKNAICSVVSRGGRADLAKQDLPGVTAKTLLIVGGWDEPVLSWNREVLPLLQKGELKVIPRATHLFEEPHALPAVIDSAVRFFRESFIPHFRPMPYRPGPERSPHP